MAAQAYTPAEDPVDPSRVQPRLLQATTLTGHEGAPGEALHTALYWAQGSPSGSDTPEPREAWLKQAKAMRNYHLHNPCKDSPAALPWPTDPPETVRNLANLTGNRGKATIQTPAEPPLRDPGQQARNPFLQPHAPPPPPPPVPRKRARRKRGTPAPSPQNNPENTSRQQPLNPSHPLRPSRPTQRPPPTRTKHPHHHPFRHKHRPAKSVPRVQKRRECRTALPQRPTRQLDLV